MGRPRSVVRWSFFNSMRRGEHSRKNVGGSGCYPFPTQVNDRKHMRESPQPSAASNLNFVYEYCEQQPSKKIPTNIQTQAAANRHAAAIDQPPTPTTNRSRIWKAPRRRAGQRSRVLPRSFESHTRELQQYIEQRSPALVSAARRLLQGAASTYLRIDDSRLSRFVTRHGDKPFGVVAADSPGLSVF